MSLLLCYTAMATTPAPAPRRTGLVRRRDQVVYDDTGPFHPLGITLFWAPYGWKYERQKLIDTLHWISGYGFDYIRVLGEVDWDDRTIDPDWWWTEPEIFTDLIDYAYDQCGLRTEMTIVGGRQFDKDDGHQRFVPTELVRQVCTVLQSRAEKILHYEMVNEFDRLDKVSFDDVIAMAKVAVSLVPNLVSLSKPRETDDEHNEGGYEEMINATTAAGATMCTPHLRRSDHDYKWSAVRQGYDLKNFDPFVASNNEGQGPQSSVDTLEDPLQLACYRLQGILCGGAPFVLHVGQGVTGEADPDHGRPAYMWEVPNIDTIMRVVRGVDVLVPDEIENWKVVNNSRDDHPLPLDGKKGFWEGSDGIAPAVNKNYAAYKGSDFVVMPIGCRSVETTGPVPVTIKAYKACHVIAYDPVNAFFGLDEARVVEADLQAGEAWSVPGRHDTMAAYWIRGTYV